MYFSTQFNGRPTHNVLFKGTSIDTGPLDAGNLNPLCSSNWISVNLYVQKLVVIRTPYNSLSSYFGRDQDLFIEQDSVLVTFISNSLSLSHYHDS